MIKTAITPEMHYDDWADFYDSDVQGWDYHAPDRILKRMTPALLAHDKAPRILDVGIGTGLLSEKCRDVRSDIKVKGIDISSKMLEICDRKGIADELHRVDISSDRFPFKNDSFDIVAAAGVMENVENIDNAIREMSRVVRPGGVVLFTYMPTTRHPARQAKPMPLRTGRTAEGKMVMGNLTLFRHNSDHVRNIARTAGVRPDAAERFVGYRTFAVITVRYDMFYARKIKGLN